MPLLNQCAYDLMTAHTRQKDELILSALSKYSPGFTLYDASFHVRSVIFPDKREVFMWDDVPLIEFYPPEHSFDGTHMKVSAKYRILAPDRKEPQ